MATFSVGQKFLTERTEKYLKVTNIFKINGNFVWQKILMTKNFIRRFHPIIYLKLRNKRIQLRVRTRLMFSFEWFEGHMP